VALERFEGRVGRRPSRRVHQCEREVVALDRTEELGGLPDVGGDHHGLELLLIDRSGVAGVLGARLDDRHPVEVARSGHERRDDQLTARAELRATQAQERLVILGGSSGPRPSPDAVAA
jgi:hypothetical protein